MINIDNIKKILLLKQFVPLVLLLASAVALISAYTAEYGFDLKPCALCLYERIPYAIVAIIAGIAIFFANKKPQIAKILSIICALVMLFEFGLSVYHVGIEQGFFEETTACSAGEVNATDINSLRESIFKQEIVSCKEELFGVSMAGWNVLYSLGLTCFVFMGYWIQNSQLKTKN